MVIVFICDLVIRRYLVGLWIVKFLYGKAFSVEPENFVELKVIEAEPGVKGNTATNVMKNAKVETGATIQVPMFVEEGETIRIDTRTGEYMSRV